MRPTGSLMVFMTGPPVGDFVRGLERPLSRARSKRLLHALRESRCLLEGLLSKKVEHRREVGDGDVDVAAAEHFDVFDLGPGLLAGFHHDA